MSTIIVLCQDPTETVECQNCRWTGKATECKPLADFEQRVSAGEYVPVGECPECGSCAHLTEAGIARAQGQQIYTDEDIAEVFWNCLRRVPGHKDRRETGYGTKTKQGLAATIRRLGWRP